MVNKCFIPMKFSSLLPQKMVENRGTTSHLNLLNDLDNEIRLQIGTKDIIRIIRSKTFEST